MDRDKLDNICEIGVFILVLVTITFSALALGAVGPWEFLVVQFSAILIGILWIIRLLFSKNFRFFWPPVCWFVLGFYLYALWRYWTADVEYVARSEFIRVTIYALVFFAVINNIYEQKYVNLTVYWLIILAFGISCYAIYQFATNSPYVWHYIKPEQYMRRGSGTFICPNHLAGFLEMILPLGLAYTIMSRLKPVPKILLGYASLFIAVGIACSISRGGWIATGLSLVILFIVLIKNRDFRIVSVVFLVLLIGLGTVFVLKTAHSKERFHELFTSGKLENIRFKLWQPAVKMWRLAPWKGIGPGHFDLRFRQFRPEDVQLRPVRVHNDYLNTLVDWGIIGFTLLALTWLVLIISAVLTLTSLLRRGASSADKRSTRAAFLMGALSGLLAILLHSLVDFNMHIPSNALLAVLLFSLISSYLRFYSSTWWTHSRWSLRIACSIIISTMLIFLAVSGYMKARETKILEQAEKLEDHDPEKPELLKKAYKIDPNNPETVHSIGQAYRMQSWQGNDNYQQTCEEAIKWLKLAVKINPYDGYAWMRIGMCLDWIKKYNEADKYFARALELDPNGYYMIAIQGWHQLNKGEIKKAKELFERSLMLKSDENPIAKSYLGIINRRYN